MESFSKLQVRIGCWERKGFFFFCDGMAFKVVLNIIECDLETKWCHRSESRCFVWQGG